MSRSRVTLAVTAVLASSVACATEHAPPGALLDARAENLRAREGIASRLAPARLHAADVALTRAEEAYRDRPDDPSTVDFAIVADRLALEAEAESVRISARQSEARDEQALKAALERKAVAERSRLGEVRQSLHPTEAELSTQHDWTAPRGNVFTLPADALFEPGKAALRESAKARLDQMAAALASTAGHIVVRGYTDEDGDREVNVDLSFRRAVVVRDYLVSRGIRKELVMAQGMGPDEPLSDNRSAEGRAQNRRLEIIVEKP
jgi:outer membrane protein OmpA-like peptidoglycan-associated protein